MSDRCSGGCKALVPLDPEFWGWRRRGGWVCYQCDAKAKAMAAIIMEAFRPATTEQGNTDD